MGRLSDLHERSCGDPDPFTDSSRAMLDLLERVETFDDLLGLVCECARVDRTMRAGDEATPHLWACPAGTVEYWASRHRAAMAAWLDRFEPDGRLPAAPTW